MKHYLKKLILLLTFSVQIANAQQEDITKTFNNFIKATKSDNLNEQLDYLYPRVFEFYSKDSILMELEMSKKDPVIKVGNEELISISEILTENNIQYAILTFNQKMNMDMSKTKEQGNNDYALFIMPIALKQIYGEDKVTFDEKLYIFEVSMTKNLYVILDPKYNEWKFLPINEKSIDVEKQIIPEIIRQKL
jgi:hypothetical protein